jgi:hypothetical protein
LNGNAALFVFFVLPNIISYQCIFVVFAAAAGCLDASPRAPALQYSSIAILQYCNIKLQPKTSWHKHENSTTGSPGDRAVLRLGIRAHHVRGIMTICFDGAVQAGSRDRDMFRDTTNAHEQTAANAAGESGWCERGGDVS